ncbi:hypothetical protein CCL14_21155 [Pseudomonas syringae]|nr:hypothetical protein CCL14_21155 [Pseudomonas syringae]
MTTCAPTPKHLALYTVFVGASLLAKAIAQTPCFLRLHWPIREQARSHRTDALRGIHTGVIDDDMRTYAEALGVVRRFGGSELARESDCPDALFSAAALAYSRASSLPRGRCATGMHTGVVDDDMRPMLKRLALYTDFVGASLLAKAIAQTPCFLRLHWPIREQARSHRTGALRGMHTGVINDDMRPHAEALGVVHSFCGSELARESDCPDALFSAAALAYSRASSLPQDRCAAGDAHRR